MQVHILVLDSAAPQTLDENVVHPSPLAVHADGNAMVLEHACERLGGEHWASWSVLKISGVPKRCTASCRASIQKSLSRVFDTRQDSTRRECQSMMATRYMNPLAMGI